MWAEVSFILRGINRMYLGSAKGPTAPFKNIDYLDASSSFRTALQRSQTVG